MNILLGKSVRFEKRSKFHHPRWCYSVEIVRIKRKFCPMECWNICKTVMIKCKWKHFAIVLYPCHEPHIASSQPGQGWRWAHAHAFTGVPSSFSVQAGRSGNTVGWAGLGSTVTTGQHSSLSTGVSGSRGDLQRTDRGGRSQNTKSSQPWEDPSLPLCPQASWADF